MTPRLFVGTAGFVEVPPDDEASAVTCAYVKIVAVAVVVTTYVPSNALLVTPAMMTLSPTCRSWSFVVVIVVTFVALTAVEIVATPTCLATASPYSQCSSRPSDDATARASSPQLSIVHENDGMKNGSTGLRSATGRDAVPPDDEVLPPALA